MDIEPSPATGRVCQGDDATSAQTDAQKYLIAWGILDPDPAIESGINLTAPVTRGELSLILVRAMGHLETRRPAVPQ